MSRFRIGTTWYERKTDIDAYLDLLRAMHGRFPTLFARLADQTGTEHCRFFARTPTALFARSPHLATEQGRYRQIVPGWYANTVLNNEKKEDIVRRACALAGFTYWEDVEIKFTRGRYSPPTRAEAQADAARLLKELEES